MPTTVDTFYFNKKAFQVYWEGLGWFVIWELNPHWRRAEGVGYPLDTLGAQVQSEVCPFETLYVLRELKSRIPSYHRLNIRLKTKECKKVINTKKVNISVLIVKIIPGQEFISNHFFPVLLRKWPSQDDHSSLILKFALDLSCPP